MKSAGQLRWSGRQDPFIFFKEPYAARGIWRPPWEISSSLDVVPGTWSPPISLELAASLTTWTWPHFPLHRFAKRKWVHLCHCDEWGGGGVSSFLTCFLVPGHRLNDAVTWLNPHLSLGGLWDIKRVAWGAPRTAGGSLRGCPKVSKLLFQKENLLISLLIVIY